MRSIHINVLVILITSSFIFSCSNSSSKETGNSQTNSSERDSSYVVDVVAADYAYGMPGEIPSGWITFRMENKGKHEHNAIIHKFPDSLGYKNLNKMVIKSIGNDNSQLFNQLQQKRIGDWGGPAGISPNGIAETTVYLEPGLYVYTCWMVAPDGKTHAEKGMQRAFKVTNEKSGATKPEETINVTLSDYVIEIEDPIEAGEQIFNVHFQNSNNVYLVRLEEDQDFEELKKWMDKVQTPSTFTFLGGAEQGPVGNSSTFTATLKPGRYALVTYGYAATGMAQEFVVPEKGKTHVKTNKANSAVTVELLSDDIRMPSEIPVGLTPMVVKNSGSEVNQYIFYLLKPGYSANDFNEYFKKAIDMTVSEAELSRPAYLSGYKVLEPGGEHSFKLNIQDKRYLIVGPLAPGIPKPSEWNPDKIHTMRGVEM